MPRLSFSSISPIALAAFGAGALGCHEEAPSTRDGGDAAADTGAPRDAGLPDAHRLDATLREDSGPPGGSFEASLQIDLSRPGPVVAGNLLGSNLSYRSPVDLTVQSEAFIDATARMGLRHLRWPSGNLSDSYDWKTHSEIRPGQRKVVAGGVDLEELLRFCRRTGAKPVVVVNFGTMTPQDAADLVEFFNGPLESEWGARRAALGYPEPLGVTHFEVGNEEYLPHMWYYSWTAQNPSKYFFGGSEERRGSYDNSTGPAEDPFGQKGDVFQIRPEDSAGQLYPLRFAPFRDVRAFWTASTADAEAGRFEEWTEVDDLSLVGPEAAVFEVDETGGGLRFGDGVHGRRPAAGSYFNVEYTTYGHAGFVDFARAMHAARSSVPIQVGSVMLPVDADGEPIAGDRELRLILEQMDFLVRHQYDGNMPVSEYLSYRNIRQIAGDRVARLMSAHSAMEEFATRLGSGPSPSLGITEWNLFLNASAWQIDRTVAGAVVGGEFLVRAIDAQPALPITVATQFSLQGGNLSLIRTQTNSAVSPLGRVFEGLAAWVGSRHLPVEVESPQERAYSRDVPYVAAAAALAEDGSTLHVALVNNAEHGSAALHLELGGTRWNTLRLRRVAGESCQDSNERNPDAVVLEDLGAEPFRTELTLPPCSVTFADYAR